MSGSHEAMMMLSVFADWRSPVAIPGKKRLLTLQGTKLFIAQSPCPQYTHFSCLGDLSSVTASESGPSDQGQLAGC